MFFFHNQFRRKQNILKLPICIVNATTRHRFNRAICLGPLFGQRPQRGRSPVEHRGTFVHAGLKSALSGLKSSLSGLESAFSGLESALSDLKSTISSVKSALSDSRPERADFRPERVVFCPERADFRLGGTDG